MNYGHWVCTHTLWGIVKPKKAGERDEEILNRPSYRVLTQRAQEHHILPI